MLILVTLGVMSLMWTSVIAILVAAQKLLPPKRASDLPLALGIIGLGILLIMAPSWIPGVVPPM
jgi:predicted metal-binding membrane protein